jgi:dienelactone hydrolase
MLKTLPIALVLAIASMVNGAIVERVVEYKDGETTLRGVAVYDDARDVQMPGVVVVPEWWGVNEFAKAQARRLAEAGYIAFVADIYGEGFNTTEVPIAAQRATEASQKDWKRTRGRLAVEQLKAMPQVDARRLGAIGFCFGGSTVLELARDGVDLRGVVSFHGSFGTAKPAQPGTVKAAVLVLHGGDDPLVPHAESAGLIKELLDAGANFEFVSYAGAQHSFTNPAADAVGIPGVKYDEATARASFEAMFAFFERVLK